MIRIIIILVISIFSSCTIPKNVFLNIGSPRFKQKINKILSSSGLNINASISFISIKEKKVLYQLNPNKLLIPASNNKLFTYAAALNILGPNYRFKTQIIKNDNNIILTGNGNPDLTIVQLDSLAGITAKKIKNIDTLFINRTFMDTLEYGKGWMWDEGSDCYAAPVSPLSINDNCIDFYLNTDKNSQKPNVSYYPETEFIKVINKSKTVSDTINIKKIKIDRDWVGRKNIFTITGELLESTTTDTIKKNIFNASLFTATIFKELLESRGIIVRNMAYYDKIQKTDTLAIHTSDPLKISGDNMMKESDNLTAELFTKTISRAQSPVGEWKIGINLIKKFLKENTRIDTSKIRITDGSGFSRYNLASSNQIIKVLTFMYYNKYNKEFIASLPYGGEKGSLEKRFLHYGDIIRAKTGHLSGVSCLSGYIYPNGESPIIFSILMNGFIGDPIHYQELQKKIIDVFIND